MTWRIERLGGSHVTRGFRCGDHRPDNFLKRHAFDNDRNGLGTTYVASDDATMQVLGYVTLCTSAVRFDHVPAENLPHYPVPTLLVARLAVDRRAQGKGVGSALMLAALQVAENVADQVGVFAVTVEALDMRAHAFYRDRFGFTELLDDPHHLFLTIADLRATGPGGD